MSFDFAHTSIAAVYIGFGAVLTSIQRYERRSYLRWWIFTFLLFGLHSAAIVVANGLGIPPVCRRLPWIGLVAGTACLLIGTYDFLGRQLDRRWILAAAMLGTTAVLGPSLGLPCRLAQALVFGYVGAGLFYTGIRVLTSGPGGGGRIITATGCLGAGTWGLVYPFFADHPTVVAIELQLDMGFLLATSIGVVLLHFELARQRTREIAGRYRSMFENALVGLFRIDTGGRILAANSALLGLLGCSKREVRSLHFVNDLFVEPAERERIARELCHGDQITGAEARWRRADGQEVRVNFAARVVRNAEGTSMYLEGSAHDVTSERQLRHQLEQAERLEAMGRLAGGIAHDFNNVLTIVMSGAELALKRLAPDHPARPPVETLLSASKGAAEFTGQLLTFSRRRALDRAPVDLNHAVRNAMRMVEGALGVSVTVVAKLAEESMMVLAGSGQVEQIVVNLALNARDAMPHGGRFTVITERTTSFDNRAFGRLVVEDDGVGMDEETRRRAFDPFYTTKLPGKGTGLGLATVYGVVQQLGGRIELASMPGHGTKFVMDLPLVDAPRSLRRRPRASAPSISDAVILLVEDRDMLRASTAQVLMEAGFSVIAAGSAEEAEAKAVGRHVDLLLTDVVMPEVAGPELVRRMRAERPALKVLFMSGYPDEQLFAEETDTPLLPKPFTVEQLTHAVRQALKQPPRAAAGVSSSDARVC